MAEKFCSEFGGGPHQLKIGKSFEKKGGSAAFHQIRYYVVWYFIKIND